MVTNKQIQKWNNYFESLSSEEKRVAIAKDVIAQMKAERITAESGTYINIEDVPEDCNISLQKYLPETHCYVCALGALFHSHIKYNNKVTFRDYLDNNSAISIPQNLQDYFDFDQLIMIEYAFEGFLHDRLLEKYDSFKVYSDLSGISSITKYRPLSESFKESLIECAKYYEYLIEKDVDNQYETFRLYQIMNNIIRNNGTFVPTDLKIEKWNKTKKKI